MSIERLSQLQQKLIDAEREYKNNPTELNYNNEIIVRDEVEIYLKWHKDEIVNYFNDEELNLTDADQEQKQNMYFLRGTILNSVREKLGVIVCTSGHRSITHNSNVNGSETSHHLCNNGYAAVDLIPKKCSLETLFNEIKENHLYAELILEHDQGVVHVSKNINPKLNKQRTSQRKLVDGKKVYF